MAENAKADFGRMIMDTRLLGFGNSPDFGTGLYRLLQLPAPKLKNLICFEASYWSAMH